MKKLVVALVALVGLCVAPLQGYHNDKKAEKVEKKECGSCKKTCKKEQPCHKKDDKKCCWKFWKCNDCGHCEKREKKEHKPKECKRCGCKKVKEDKTAAKKA